MYTLIPLLYPYYTPTHPYSSLLTLHTSYLLHTIHILSHTYIGGSGQCPTQQPSHPYSPYIPIYTLTNHILYIIYLTYTIHNLLYTYTLIKVVVANALHSSRFAIETDPIYHLHMAFYPTDKFIREHTTHLPIIVAAAGVLLILLVSLVR
jgi:hypothetical protein